MVGKKKIKNSSLKDDHILIHKLGCREQAEVPGEQPAKNQAHISLSGSLSSLIPREVSGSVTYLGFLFVKKQ